MTRPRLIQLAAVLLAVACLTATAALSPTINRQRREMGLSDRVMTGGQRVSAKYAIVASLGSFRGLAVDALWYRAEQLKRQGKFFESNSLAEWITTLQPRFPQVWVIQAWNMAYNISVKTYTPEERWEWVNKGIRLLRDQAIVYNPDSTILYRELAWMFFHKLGKDMDDMHWYYKAMFALEWQELLGAPTEGATKERALAEFAPIKDAAERYFVFNRLTLDARKQLIEIASEDPVLSEPLLDVADQNLVNVNDVLRGLERKLKGQDNESVRRLVALRELVDREMNRHNRGSLEMFYEDHPAARQVVDRLAELGFDLNLETLRAIGQHLMLLRYAPVEVVTAQAEEHGTETEKATLALLLDPQLREGWAALLPYLRAKVVTEDYHMDPGVMYEVMEQFGPLDWRHPASHGIYWAFLGIRYSDELTNENRIAILNTDRQIIHGLQELFHRGRINFDPFSRYLDLLPDPRFIPAYENAVSEASNRTENRDIEFREGTIESLQAGHENLLIKAVVICYFYGDIDEARYYYDKVRSEYSDKAYNRRSGRYNMTLEDFVIKEVEEDFDQSFLTRGFVDSMIYRGIVQGLANYRTDIFARHMRIARVAYDKFQQEKSPTAIATQGRQKLLDFNEIVYNSFTEFMRNPSVPVRLKMRVWRNTPLQIARQTYLDFKDAVATQSIEQSIDPELAFAPPPGLDLTQIDEEKPAETPETIERQ